jgi:hypothetical protein
MHPTRSRRTGPQARLAVATSHARADGAQVGRAVWQLNVDRHRSRSRYYSQKALSRLVSSGSRTRDPSITSRLLYPTELWTITANMGLEPTTSGNHPRSTSELDRHASAGSPAAAYTTPILRHGAPGRTHEPHPLTACSTDEFCCASRPLLREAHISHWHLDQGRSENLRNGNSWCIPVVSNHALRLFTTALSPDQLGMQNRFRHGPGESPRRGTATGNRTGRCGGDPAISVRSAAHSTRNRRFFLPPSRRQKFGTPSGTRTPGLRFRRTALFHLS